MLGGVALHQLEEPSCVWAAAGLPRPLQSLAPAQGKIIRKDLNELSHEVGLLSRRVMDRLKEKAPAFREALRKALAEKNLALSQDELQRRPQGKGRHRHLPGKEVEAVEKQVYEPEHPRRFRYARREDLEALLLSYKREGLGEGV